MTIICTHDGTFHLDDIMSAAILISACEDVTILRSRDPAVQATADIVFDVGGGRFDHHFKNAEKRSSGITYSSCGLIWREFGKQFLLSQKVPDNLLLPIWMEWDRIIESVDAHDNGEGDGLRHDLSLVGIVGAFNGVETFDDVALFVNRFLVAKTKGMVTYHNDALMVRKAIADRKVPEIIVLNRDMLWHTVVHEEAPDALYVAFHNYGKWRVTCVPTEPGSFVNKCPLVKAYRGLLPDELRKVSGLPLTFIHAAGFTGGAETYEAILELIRRSMIENGFA